MRHLFLLPDPRGAGEPHSSAFAPELHFSCARIDGGDDDVRLIVFGEIDLATAGELARELCQAQADAHTVTLDLRRLLFIDCSGLAVLAAAAERASAGGDRFRVVRGPPVVDRVFTLTGLEHRFEMTSGTADPGSVQAL
ncbi:STAS domain-containing protein [Solirubrobacter taibaiensis]|nr:STAS domain-containing protein [Solirubrobacter taibaiensis]